MYCFVLTSSPVSVLSGLFKACSHRDASARIFAPALQVMQATQALDGFGLVSASAFTSPPFTLGKFMKQQQMKAQGVRKVCARILRLRLRQVTFVFIALATVSTHALALLV